MQRIFTLERNSFRNGFCFESGNLTLSFGLGEHIYLGSYQRRPAQNTAFPLPK